MLLPPEAIDECGFLGELEDLFAEREEEGDNDQLQPHIGWEERRTHWPTMYGADIGLSPKA